MYLFVHYLYQGPRSFLQHVLPNRNDEDPRISFHNVIYAYISVVNELEKCLRIIVI